MSSFTSTFGNSPVSPVEVAYAAYSFNENLVLFWPQFSQGQSNVAARFMNMIATAGSLNVYMPDATLNSVGYDTIIFNAGSDTFNMVTFNGNPIVTIAPGQTYYLMLNSNTTQDGGWQTVQFGVGTGSAVASALAGAGLLAASGLLEVNLNGIMVSTNYNIIPSQRAILQVWTGGTGIITLPLSSSVGNGFFFPLANNGTGSVTVTASGSDLIDGNATSVFSQTQSGFILSTGTGWITVGKGIQNTFSVTLLNLNVAGASNVTLTSAQAQNIIQQYTGVLTGNIEVIVPNTVQIYYIYNNTNGPYTLTVITSGGTGIQVDQGQHAILYCDGTNVVNAFTATITSTISIVAGSSASPSINVQGSSSTGIYSPTANQIAISANGFEVTNFVSSGTAVNYLQLSSTATGNPPSISAKGSDINVGIGYIAQGTGVHNFTTGGGNQFSITDATSAVNFLNVKGAATTAYPQLSVSGTDTDIGISYAVKGAGVHSFTGAMSVSGAITANLIGNITGNLTGNVTGNISGTAPAWTLTGATLASNVVTSSLVNFGGSGLGVFTFSKSNSGSGTNLAIANLNSASGTTSSVQLITGTANAFSLIEQVDGAVPFLNISSGSGNTAGIVIDGSAATTSIIQIKSGSQGITLNPNGGPLNVQGVFEINGLSTDTPLQRVSTITGAVATGTTIISFVDTIPTNTSGDQYMSLSITPKSATSILEIEVIACFSSSHTSGDQISMALFQDSTANALAAQSQITPTAPSVMNIKLYYKMTSGTTSLTTFKIRAGGANAGTITFNGQSGGRIFGGIMASSMKITEWLS